MTHGKDGDNSLERSAAQVDGQWDVGEGRRRTDLFFSFYALLANGLARRTPVFKWGVFG